MSRRSTFRTTRFGGGGNERPAQDVRRQIRNMTSLIADPVELDSDRRRLQDALASSGEHALGVDAISVWMLNEDDGNLVHPPGGWWRCPDMEVDGEAARVALARMEDSTRDDYVPPAPVSAGTDIAGILWAESPRGDNLNAPTRRTTVLRQSSALNLQPTVWRDIKSISQNPDATMGPRVKLIEEAGFTMAAGITFEYKHHQGMIMFLTTMQDENDDRLTGVTHGAYLHQAAQLIGATMSLAELRRASLAERYKLEKVCYNMTEHTGENDADGHLLSSTEEGKDENPNAGDAVGAEKNDGKDKDSKETSNLCPVPHRFLVWSRKLKGGSGQVPPTMTWTQTAWTVVGTLLNLLALVGLNEYYQVLSNDDYFLILGPFGAMCTLYYGLSGAPASQPRNAIMGQVVAGAVSLAFTYVPEHILPVWARTAVGPAFAVGAMVKLGVVHPPAGAHSVLYASGKYDWVFYSLVILSTAISVVPAMVVNNISSKRQYPTYWGLPSWFRLPSSFDKKMSKSVDNKNDEAAGITKDGDISSSSPLLGSHH